VKVAGTDYVFIARRDWWPTLQSELQDLPAYDDYADGSRTYLGAAIHREEPLRVRWGDTSARAVAARVPPCAY